MEIRRSTRRVLLPLLVLAAYCPTGTHADSPNDSAPNLTHPQQVIQLQHQDARRVPVISCLDVHPGGNLLATSGDDHIVRLWELPSGRLLRQLKGHKDWVTAVRFCGDGQELVTGCRDRQVLVWDVATGRMTKRLGGFDTAITSIEISRNDQVAVASFRAPLRVYDLATGRLRQELDCPSPDIRAIAFSDDEQKLAAAGRQGDVRIWDLSDGQWLDAQPHRRRVRALAFGGPHLLSASEDQTVCVLHRDTGQLLHRMELGAGKLFALTMINQQTFAAASSKNDVRLYRLADEQPRAILRGHTGTIPALQAVDDRLLSGSFDTTVRVWKLPQH